MDEFKDFGRWIKARRLEKNLTQAGLGQRAHCAAVTIRKIEAGTLPASGELAALIVNALEAEQSEAGNDKPKNT